VGVNSSGSFGHHHIDIPALASGTAQSLAPVNNRSLIAVSPNHLRGVGLDLMAAFFAPHD